MNKSLEKRNSISPEAAKQLRQHLPALPKKTPYSAHITRETPALILFLLDQSGSMMEETEHGPKSEVVAQTVDALLEEIINRCRKSEGIRDYFQIGLLGYGGQDTNSAYIAWEGALKGRKFVPASEINKHPLRTDTLWVEKSIHGRVIQYKKEVRSWVNPVAFGNTPMFAGLRLAKQLAHDWIALQNGKDVFPPILFHITDGQATDANNQDLLQLANELKALQTYDGALLLFNVHVSVYDASPVLFPAVKSELPKQDRFASLLFDMSSKLPDMMCAEIKNGFNRNTAGPFKALAYNAGGSELIKLLNIGTSTSFTRMIE